MIFGQNIKFRDIKTPVESRRMTRRIARELAKQIEEEKKKEDIPDADDSAINWYSPSNEKPRA